MSEDVHFLELMKFKSEGKDFIITLKYVQNLKSIFKTNFL